MSGQAEQAVIYHLVYASLAVERLKQTQLLDLLKISRLNNEARGLTGMLLYRDGLYLQLLEGPREEVTRLIGKLSRDPRHKKIRILRQGVIRKRLFPEGSMAYKNLAGLRSSLVPGYSEHLQGCFETGGGKTPADLLTNMLAELLSNPAQGLKQTMFFANR
jgi:Sensors of blue-light using FAD